MHGTGTLKPLFFELPGTPVPKPRMTQRDRFLPSRAAQRYFAWAEHCKLVARQHLVRELGADAWLCGPVSIRVVFYLPIPRSAGKAERERRRLLPHQYKPDLKNLVAGLEDALNKVIWEDDAQIYCYRDLSKVWTAERQGLTQLTVYRADE